MFLLLLSLYVLRSIYAQYCDTYRDDTPVGEEDS